MIIKRNFVLLIILLSLSFAIAGCPEQVPDEDDELPDVEAPPSVALFAAQATTTEIVLTWDVIQEEDLSNEDSAFYAPDENELPAESEDVCGVMIVRWDEKQPDFYPERGDTYAVGDTFGTGVVVAVLGKDTEEYIDQDVVAGHTYFYEAFAYDEKPNYAQPAQLNTTPGSLIQGRLAHTQTTLADGRVLLCGGLGSSGPLDTAEIFDPNQNEFVPLASTLSTERFSHSATRLDDGRVLIVGGYRGAFEQTLASAEIFDPANGEFTRIDSEISIGVAMHTATLLPDGRVLIVGGTDGVDALAQMAVFDPSTNEFTTLDQELPHPRYGHQAVLDGETVYIIGGFDGTRTLKYIAAIDTTDFTVRDLDGSIGEAEDMLTARVNHTASLLATGKWLVVGGTFGTLANAEPVALSEIFEPLADNPFVYSGELATARSGHTAVVLEDGSVLIAGGIGADLNILDSAELYDPTSGEFAATGHMRLSRTVHAASLLPDGRVLVTGGNRSADLFLPEPASTAEIFDPVAGEFIVVGE